MKLDGIDGAVPYGDIKPYKRSKSFVRPPTDAIEKDHDYVIIIDSVCCKSMHDIRSLIKISPRIRNVSDRPVDPGN